MLKTELTGLKRYRVETRLFRSPLIVLQLEHRVRGHIVDKFGLLEDVDYFEWKDATLEHLTMLKEINE